LCFVFSGVEFLSVPLARCDQPHQAPEGEGEVQAQQGGGGDQAGGDLHSRILDYSPDFVAFFSKQFSAP
jgi:hypothetical protein